MFVAYTHAVKVKPVDRADFLHKLITSVREQDFPYQKRSKKRMDWSSYDTAQCTEIADMLDLIRDLVDAADQRVRARKTPEKPSPGRPPVEAADVAKVMMAQSYLGLSNRGAEGMLILFWRNLGIKRAFSYKTIERGYDKEAVNEILDEVMDLSNEPIEGKETTFSIDGSGTPTNVRQNYSDDRKRQNGKSKKAKNDAFPKGDRDYVYAVAVIGTRYKIFSSYQNTSRHDISELAFVDKAVAETKVLHPEMDMLCGDGYFANRNVCKTLQDHGVTPRLLPRRNATTKRKGVFSWTQMVMELMKDPQQWLSEYYKREASETGFSMLKLRNPGPLKKRLIPRRLTEDRLRGLIHNARRLCYLYYLEDVETASILKRPNS